MRSTAQPPNPPAMRSAPPVGRRPHLQTSCPLGCVPEQPLAGRCVRCRRPRSGASEQTRGRLEGRGQGEKKRRCLSRDQPEMLGTLLRWTTAQRSQVLGRYTAGAQPSGGRNCHRPPVLKALPASASSTTPATSPPGTAGSRGPASPPIPSRSCGRETGLAIDGRDSKLTCTCAPGHPDISTLLGGTQVACRRANLLQPCGSTCLVIHRIHAGGSVVDEHLASLAGRHGLVGDQLEHRRVAVAAELHPPCHGAWPAVAELRL